MTGGEISKETIEQEFPGWEAFQGVNRLWHARIKGSTPPVMVHGEDLIDLRDQVRRRIAQTEDEAYQRRRRPRGEAP